MQPDQFSTPDVLVLQIQQSPFMGGTINPCVGGQPGSVIQMSISNSIEEETADSSQASHVA